LETRLRHLEEGRFAALILAEAGLERLGLGNVITEKLSPDWMLPAVGQGALGLECRADDKGTKSLIGGLEDWPTRQAVDAERSFLRALGGGCLAPIGALAEVEGPTLNLRGVVLSPDGRLRLAGAISGLLEDAEAIGERLAEDLLGQGAGNILKLSR
jgi:hydroxymethylbilane synthase